MVQQLQKFIHFNLEIVDLQYQQVDQEQVFRGQGEQIGIQDATIFFTL